MDEAGYEIPPYIPQTPSQRNWFIYTMLNRFNAPCNRHGLSARVNGLFTKVNGLPAGVNRLPTIGQPRFWQYHVSCILLYISCLVLAYKSFKCFSAILKPVP